jgi:hypothetical protein
MTRATSIRFFASALAFSLLAGIATAPRAAAQAGAPFIQIPAEQSYRQVLEKHGQFFMHQTYGVVWLPTTMPQGWRPYSDCKWVQHQTWGWFYSDQTEWGRIVHHYGRWAHDEKVGWMWLPGAEWSPGWVVWRSGDTHVGWAPMPPDVDVARIPAEQFNSDKHWQFLEKATMQGGCAQAPQTPARDVAAGNFRDTRIVTKTRFVNGVFVVEVPVVAVTVVNFDVGIVVPWSPGFIGGLFANWNHIWNEVGGQSAILNAALNQCTLNSPDKKLNLPFRSNPPTNPGPATPPPGRRADLPPPGPGSVAPPIVNPPSFPPSVVTPPVVNPPSFPLPPVVVIPPRQPDPPRDPHGPRNPRDPKGPKNPKNPDGPVVSVPPGGTTIPPKGPTRPPRVTPSHLPPRVAAPPRILQPPKGPAPILRQAPRPPGPALRSVQPRFAAPQPRLAVPQLHQQPRLPVKGFGPRRPQLF